MHQPCSSSCRTNFVGAGSTLEFVSSRLVTLYIAVIDADTERGRSRRPASPAADRITHRTAARLVVLDPLVRLHGVDKNTVADVSPRTYYDRTADREALMVKRNAPRWIRMLRRYGYVEPVDAGLMAD